MNGGSSTNPKQIMVIAGEVSGDLHAAGLVTAFKALDPDAHFFGVGGAKLAEAGCENLYSVDEVAFLGFTEVIRHIPFIRNMMQKLLRECIKRKPYAVILVDYPGFNLRLAERLKRSGETGTIPILYYISPQVWAWHKSRIPKIARLVDRMAVIFDFEVPLYRDAGLAVEFVGHPLLEVTRTTQTHVEFRDSLEIPPQDRLLALLPGSRAQEVKRLLPLFLDTYNKLVQRIPDLRVAVGCSPALDVSLYRDLLKRSGSDTNRILLLQNQTTNLQAHSDVALVASGTATLETAILGTPMVVAYKVAHLTYTIGRLLVKIPNIALVNVVAGQKVVPEFVQGGATPEHISDALYILLTSSLHREKMKSNLEWVRKKLGQPGASGKVAEILSSMIREKSSHAA